jgi:hypothetical protein
METDYHKDSSTLHVHSHSASVSQPVEIDKSSRPQYYGDEASDKGPGAYSGDA